MNNWQKKFAEKVELVRKTARTQFHELADRILAPVFEEFRGFTSAQGFCATAPVRKPDVWALKFAMTENAYLLMTFRLAGFEHCELQTDVFVPGHGKHACTPIHIELASFDEAWVRRMFELALDQFVNRFVESLASRDDSRLEVVVK